MASRAGPIHNADLYNSDSTNDPKISKNRENERTLH